MRIDDRAVNLIKSHEGIVLDDNGMAIPYLCPAGIWTIGFGNTSINGKPVTRHTPPITIHQAEALFRYHIEEYSIAVLQYTDVQLSPLQLGVLVSFAYNLGIGSYKRSTLRKRVNSGDWDDVPYQLSRWVNANGVKLNGLVRRRSEEGDLWIIALNELYA